MFASRRQHLLEVIDPALERGATVFCDRFTDSTMAYQGYGRGVSLEVLSDADELATGCRVPDHTILFDLPAAEARRRGQSQERSESGGGRSTRCRGARRSTRGCDAAFSIWQRWSRPVFRSLIRAAAWRRPMIRWFGCSDSCGAEDRLNPEGAIESGAHRTALSVPDPARLRGEGSPAPGDRPGSDPALRTRRIAPRPAENAPTAGGSSGRMATTPFTPTSWCCSEICGR